MGMSTTTQSEMTVSCSIRDDGIIRLTLDMPGKSANILNQKLFDDLDKTLDEIIARGQNNYRGLILDSAKPRFFVAGADLVGISKSLDWPPERIRKFCLDGQTTMARLGQFEFPTIAAINGICVGGGLELALSCDFRIASTARNTMLGLPEVNLGLIPGWRGTARTPRLSGLDVGLDLVTSGRLVNSDEADALLLVDELAEPDQLIESCAAFILNLDPKKITERRNQVCSPMISGQVKANSLEDWNSKIEANSAIHPFAAEVAAEHMIRSATMDLEEAGKSEAEAMTQVWGCESNRGLLHMFFVDERIKKNPGTVPDNAEALNINTVGIVGAGQMGTQIATALSNTGCKILIYDTNQNAAKDLSIKLKQNCQTDSVMDLSELKSCDFIIESIVENAQIKRDVLSRVEEFVSTSTVIASNTSAIPISELVSNLKHPERLIGIHFCHPVKKRKICELIQTDATNDTTLVTAMALSRSIRKMPLIVGDRPGFVVNRILAPMLDQAVNLVGLGYQPERIDKIARDFGFELGPIEFIDAIGIDTLFQAGVIFAERLPHIVGRSRILPHLIKAGRLGQKSEHGFYRYESRYGSPEIDRGLFEFLGETVDNSGAPNQLTDADLLSNLLMPMLVEASRVLEESVVRDARDIDFASVHGCSFPAHRGGLLFWADGLERKSLLHSLEKVATLRPGFCTPEMIESLSQLNSKFHDQSA